jgi:putative membrane protein
MSNEERTYAVPEGSHAREFLASERTFLAWIRTSVAVISFGFAVIKFDDWVENVVSRPGRDPGPYVPLPIGGILIFFGGALAALGAWHYRRTNKQIESGRVKPSRSLVYSVAGFVVLLSVSMIVYLLIRGEYR